MSVNTDLNKIINIALKEDHALNDVTSDLIFTKNHQISFTIATRQDLVLCGSEVINLVFLQLKKSAKFKNSKIKLEILAKDKDHLKSGQIIARGNGDAKLILAAERTILNLIQHLSAIATTTNNYVKIAKNIKILDTRKTIPGLRNLQKYAVKCGGGTNHRLHLADMILIKDNHIAAATSLSKAIEKAKRNTQKLKIEVECDNIAQVKEAVKCKVDIIMLDNMTIAQIKEAVKIINKSCKIEISGGINLDNIKNYQGLNIDYISIGALTHSVKAVDIGLDM